jgi:hypothetical protein
MGSAVPGRLWASQDRPTRYRFSVFVTEAWLTCPECGFAKVEAMPSNACQHFYRCDSCNALLKPLPGDCCVFCSYADHVCPPKQAAALSSGTSRPAAARRAISTLAQAIRSRRRLHARGKHLSVVNAILSDQKTLASLSH